LITLRWSGGKPPFLTCELAGLEPSFWMLTFHAAGHVFNPPTPSFENDSLNRLVISFSQKTLKTVDCQFRVTYLG
jgi:hypothetical protein